MARIKYIILFILISATTCAQEKLFIQTDKPGYHAGETIWFRIDVKPAGSSIAYIELLDSANTPVRQGKVKLAEAWGAGSLNIPANFKAGNYLLRGYTNVMKNYGAESFFTKQVRVINLLQSTKTTTFIKNTLARGTDIDTDKAVYKPREKVVINIPSLKNASISVYKDDSLHPDAASVIALPSPTLNNSNFRRETGGNVVTGKVTSIKSGQPVPNTNCYLSVIGPVNKFYTTTSDSLGIVQFELKNVYDENQVVLQAGDSNYRVEINNGFFNEYTPAVAQSAAGVGIDHNTLVDHAVSAQVQLIYNRNRDSVNTFTPDTLPFYGYAEYNYLVDEYVKFSSVEDIFREYIRPVQILRREGALVPIIFLDKERVLMNKSPFVLIDNIPIFDMQQLMRMNPARIVRIDVVDRPYWFGRQFYNGVISVTTRTKDPEDYLSRTAAVQDYKGVQLSKNFYSPVYDTEAKRNSRLPDFRNVLYWSPKVDSDRIEFYTSDLPGEYIINVQETNGNGELINKTGTFKVE